MKILRTIFWGIVSFICPQMGLEEIKDVKFVRCDDLSEKRLGQTEPIKNAQRGVNKCRSKRIDGEPPH